MRNFQDKVSYVLDKIVKEEYGLSLEYPLWESPRKQEFGDLSSMAALKLASRLKADPLEVAVRLKAVLEKALAKDIDKIEILRPGFINIFISAQALIHSLNRVLKEKDNFFRKPAVKQKVLIEFLSANPTGPLSIAHGRQAVAGDAIANLLTFFGNNVKREYYLNDEGRQIELLISSVEARAKEIKGEKFTFPEAGYKGEYVKDIAGKLLKAKAKDTRKFILKHIISLIKKDLHSLGIEFDNWFSQKKLISGKKVEEAIEVLKKKGLIYEKDGALWFSSTKLGDDKDRVIRKADGELTYFASDIAYHRDKIERGFNRLINLWGPDHHGYIKRVKSVLKALKHKEDILKIIIIQLVTLKTRERMSKRAGTMILLSDLIKDVGPNAARFYYLTRRNSSHLEFDIDLAKEASFDNPLYYIHYVCARIESIFRKAGKVSIRSNFSRFLTGPEDLRLLRALLQFSYCLDKAYYSQEPVFIIEFLKELASSFHKFYEKNRVLGEDEKISRARLNLISAVRIVFHCGFSLLGIKPVERM
jgi:arginyl-tRNA synthetase